MSASQTATAKWWAHPRARMTGLACGALALAGLVVWFFLFRPYVSTDDARVAATIVRIAPDSVSGRVEKLHVTEGDQVTRGAVLIELNHERSQATLDRAEARARMASHDYKRAGDLSRQNGIPDRDLDRAAAEAQTAEADLKLARVAFEETTLHAPLDGIVVQKSIEVGNILQAGQVALSLADVDHAWIAANIEETSVGRVRVGQPVKVSIDEGGSLTGHVSEVRAAVASEFALIPSDNAAGNFTKLVQRVPIKVELDPHPGRTLRPGQSVEVKIRVD